MSIRKGFVMSEEEVSAVQTGPILVLPGEGATAPGSPYHYKATAAQTQGAYAALEITAPVGYKGPPLHRHPREEEAWYVLEGELEFTVEGKTFDAVAGSFVVVPRGLAHTFGNGGTTQARYLVLISPPTFADMFQERALGVPTEVLHKKYGIETLI